MWDMEPRKILVAVDSTGSPAAVRYAVQDARRRRGVTLGRHRGLVAGGADVGLRERRLRGRVPRA
jgi:hypothetical protein